MKRALFVLSLLLSAPAQAQVAAHLTPAEADAAFRAATDACLRDERDACIQGYEKLISGGWESPDLYFNLGTAFLRQDRIGKAVLYLERALRLDPADADARANLERAERMRVDKLEGAPEEATAEEPLPKRIALSTRGGAWAVAFLCLWLSGGLLLALRRLFPGSGRQAIALVTGIVLLVAAIPCAAVTAAHAWVGSQDEAVIVAPTLPLREGPAEGLKPAYELHEGLKVRVLDQEGAFKRIRLPNGLQGWVPADGVASIKG